MALDIGIGNGTSLSPVNGELSISLDNDGYYWFLHPLFEDLRAATGQYIDLESIREVTPLFSWDWAYR
jgi:hypothetical protein